MKKSSNLKKHTSKNPLQRILVDRFQDAVAAEVKKLKPESLLSVGCGEGFDLRHIMSFFRPKRIVGVDFDNSALRYARMQLPKVVFKKADATKLPFKDREFDLVLALEVIEHIKEFEKALDEIKRVTKKFALITVPWEPWFSVLGLLRGKYIKRLGRHPEHVNAWGKKAFLQTLKERDLEIKKYKIIFPWQMVLVYRQNEK